MNSRRPCASCGSRGSSRHHALSAPSLRRDDSLPPLASPGAAPFDALGAGCTELRATLDGLAAKLAARCIAQRPRTRRSAASRSRDSSSDYV